MDQEKIHKGETSGAGSGSARFRKQEKLECASDKTPMITITVFLVNYRRQQNLKQIVSSIRANKYVEEIVIFNNDPDVKVRIEGVTVINSGKNWRCWVKYIFTQLIKTKWVLIIDDDISLEQNTVEWFLENAKRDEEGIYGFFGMNLNKGSYSKGDRVDTKNVRELTKVDVLLGRIIFCKTSKLAMASYHRSRIPDYQSKEYLFNESEDIVLSMANTKEGHNNYVIVSPKDMGYVNLSEGEGSLSRRGIHMRNRDSAVKDTLELK